MNTLLFGRQASHTAPGRESRPLLAATVLWGVATWFPVGLAYLALLLTTLTLLFAPDRRARWQHVKKSGLLLFPGLFFVWILLAFIAAPHGEMVAKILFHSGRFVLTIVLGLMLWPREAKFGIAAFAAVGALMLLALLAEVTVGGVLRWPGLLSVLDYEGNKSIRAGILLCCLAAAVGCWALWRHAGDRKTPTALALLILGGALLAVMFYVKTRSAMLILPLVLAGIALHRLRSPRAALATVLIVLATGGVLHATSENLRSRISEGVTLLQADIASDRADSSWGQRYRFYVFSLARIAEHPLLGAGPGTWGTAWQAANAGTPWDGFGNPHSDYLLFGSEAGLPALAFLLLTYLHFLRRGWRQKQVWGGIALAFAVTTLLTGAINAGMRDAAFGLSLVWLMAATMAATRNEQDDQGGE